MCGIFGAVGNYDVSKLKILALFNETRGRDSSGFFNGTHLLKVAKPVRELLTNEFLKTKHPFMMGHTRFATTGAVTDDNSHPFQHGRIIGTHNGVVSNFDELKLKYDLKDMQVDSEIIFWGLDKFGVEFLKEVEAYWGLAWFNQSDTSGLYLSVHSHELAVAHAPKAFYYASDIKDLERIGLKPVSLKDDHLYRVDVKTLQMKREKLRGLKSRFAYSYHSYKSCYPDPYERFPENIHVDPLDPLAVRLTDAELDELMDLEYEYERAGTLQGEKLTRYFELSEKDMKESISRQADDAVDEVIIQ